MAYDQDALRVYHNFVAERHRIWVLRQLGHSGPWTNDPILQNMKFTNMFRVLDPGSQFVFRLGGLDPANVVTRLVFYRMTNLPETWGEIHRVLGRYPVRSDFLDHRISDLLLEYHDAGNKVFSGAYIIIPEPGTSNNKIEGAVRVARRFAVGKAEEFCSASSQSERYEVLRSVPGMGKFLSMQVLTDWTYLQKDEPDLSFVVAGPGARRGAAILNDSLPAEQVIEDLTASWGSGDLQLAGRPITAMDVQNTLCETFKYFRARANLRKTTPYRPAHPGVQPKAVLPTWW